MTHSEEDINSALNDVFPNGKPAPLEINSDIINKHKNKPEIKNKNIKIELVGNKKSEGNIMVSTSNAMKALLYFFALVGLGAATYVCAWQFKPEVFGDDPLANLEVEEAGRIKAIMKYCSRGTQDQATCKAWLSSYKEMLTGERDEETALFDRESQERIAEMKRHRGLEAEAAAASVGGTGARGKTIRAGQE